MTTGRYYHTATLLANGKVLITGGQSNSEYLDSAELYDPENDIFSPTTHNMTMERAQHAATLLTGGMVLITGGIASSISLSSAELYNPETDAFTPISGSLTTLRYQQTSTMQTDGKVLLTGGGSPVPPSQSYTNSAELFDPFLYQGPLVRVTSDPTAIYETLQGAYDAALDNDVLTARNIIFNDSDLTLRRNISVRLKGGLAADFTTAEGYTTIFGAVKVISGKLQLENLIIK
jgi:hypothetical protein